MEELDFHTTELVGPSVAADQAVPNGPPFTEVGGLNQPSWGGCGRQLQQRVDQLRLHIITRSTCQHLIVQIVSMTAAEAAAACSGTGNFFYFFCLFFHFCDFFVFFFSDMWLGP
jgi:hypothetical protein